MRIGFLAARAGIPASRIRFYESKGLLPPPARRASGYRDYDDEALATLMLIRRAQRLGYSLAEIALYLHAPDGEGRRTLLLRCIEIKLAEYDGVMADTESRSARLRELRDTLCQVDYRPA
jgi:DNA-binding transcriptional MerR regulator